MTPDFTELIGNFPDLSGYYKLTLVYDETVFSMKRRYNRDIYMV